MVVLPGILLAGPPADFHRALDREDWQRAEQILDSLDAAGERTFLRGLLAFKRGNLSRARSRFQALIRSHPDHERVPDALLYLDRIQLRQPDTQPVPTVRVRLADTTRIQGTFEQGMTVLHPDRRVMDRLTGGSTWTVTSRSGSLRLRSGGELRARGQRLILDPNSSDGFLRWDGRAYRGRFELIGRDGRVLLINSLPVEDYLYGVVRKEIAPGWPMPTVKAQAVAARSFALHHMRDARKVFDLDSSGQSQVYGGVKAETARVREAVRETRGEVLTYRGSVVPAYFHANSGGFIETAQSIWGGSKTPFIVSKPDPWSRDTHHFKWEQQVSLDRVRKALGAKGYPAPAEYPGVTVVKRLPSGRSLQIRYRTRAGSTRTIRATTFRNLLGTNLIKSTWITAVQKRGRSLFFEGRGWGHGVGMSQWGAHRMGSEGHNYREILQFYYEKARLTGEYGPSTLVSDGGKPGE